MGDGSGFDEDAKIFDAEAETIEKDSLDIRRPPPVFDSAGRGGGSIIVTKDN